MTLLACPRCGDLCAYDATYCCECGVTVVLPPKLKAEPRNGGVSVEHV